MSGMERKGRRLLKDAQARRAAGAKGPSLAALVGDPTQLSIRDVMAHPKLFGPLFSGPSWSGWRAFLAALFGLALTVEELAAFCRFTGRTTPPADPCREAWLIVGRRGGKSRIAALVAVYLACFRSYAHCLAPGERGTVMILAADRKQARTLLRYVRGLLESVPALAALIETPRRESIDLRNGITIEVHTASYRTVRGYTVVAALADEIAFWSIEADAANPDTEVLDALRPALATIPESILLGLSTPYARRGELYEAHSKHYGKDGDPVLVWQADTSAMNPAVDPAVIARAYTDDPQAASAEYGAQFRSDVAAFITREALGAVVVLDRHELPPTGRHRYRAFVDPSGGSQDAFTLAIAHREGDTAVLDLVREVPPPFSPDDTVRAFADEVRRYGLREVTGDNYAGVWPAERFARHGITYRRSESTRSDLYKTLLPLLMAGRAELLDDRRLRTQLLALERRTARSGRDSIDHPPGGHDDVANAAAGALVLAVPAALTGTAVTQTVYQ